MEPLAETGQQQWAEQQHHRRLCLVSIRMLSSAIMIVSIVFFQTARPRISCRYGGGCYRSVLE